MVDIDAARAVRVSNRFIKVSLDGKGKWLWKDKNHA